MGDNSDSDSDSDSGSEYEPDPKPFHCEYCEYKTNKKYNLTQHMVLKHLNIKDTIVEKQENKCEKCNRTLCSKQSYKNHIEKCKGKINPLECIHCNKIFKYAPHNYRHRKICKLNPINKEAVADELTPSSTPQTQNVQINNNLTNSNNNTITNNIINIKVYKDIYSDEYEEDQGFSIDGLEDKIKKILKIGNLTEMTRRYNRVILSKKENQIVRKTNLRSPHSLVHIGNNKWETILDREIYPHMISSLSNSFMAYLDFNNLLRTTYKTLEKFLDYMADGGYINADETIQREMQKKYKVLEADCRSFIYDLTTILDMSANS